MAGTRHDAESHTSVQQVLHELLQAEQQYPPMRSLHEGLAIIREEYLELEREVFKHDPDPEALCQEACQLAAMALRFMRDLGLA